MKARILLIEDEPALRTMLEAVLHTAGYEVWPAPHGRVAVEILGRRAIDLVVTDIVMPEQEGIETILKIRRMQPNMPVIAMSGGGRLDPAQYLQIAKTVGATQLLAKPFSSAKLLALVREMLSEPVAG